MVAGTLASRDSAASTHPVPRHSPHPLPLPSGVTCDVTSDADYVSFHRPVVHHQQPPYHPREWKKVCYLIRFAKSISVKNIFAFSINSQHWCRFFKSFFIEDKGLPVLHIQYDVCWWPGDARSLVCLEYSVISIRRGNSTIFPPKYSSKHSIARPWGWGMGCPLTHLGRVTHIYNGKLHNNWFR